MGKKIKSLLKNMNPKIYYFHNLFVYKFLFYPQLYFSTNYKGDYPLISQHSGYSDEEVFVPLIVIDTNEVK